MNNFRTYFPDNMSRDIGLGVVVRPFNVPSWNVFYVTSKSINGDTQEVNIVGYIVRGNKILSNARYYAFWRSTKKCTELTRLFHYFDIGSFYHILCHTIYFNYTQSDDEIMLLELTDIYKITKPFLRADIVCILHEQDHHINYNFELRYLRRIKFVQAFNFENIIEDDDYDHYHKKFPPKIS
jgi:hypothetical protein